MGRTAAGQRARQIDRRGCDYAESWEIADCGDDQSTVARGPFAGWTSGRAGGRTEGPALFGASSARLAPHFPLLIKFLDCNDRLSVQVHPNDEQARKWDAATNGKRKPGSSSNRSPGSRIYCGSEAGGRSAGRSSGISTRARWRNVCHSFPRAGGRLCFRSGGNRARVRRGHPARGDAQSSDVTFRLFDWGRVGARTASRDLLHREEALACIDFAPRTRQSGRAAHRGGEERPHRRLVRSNYFALRRRTLEVQADLDGEPRGQDNSASSCRWPETLTCGASAIKSVYVWGTLCWYRRRQRGSAFYPRVKQHSWRSGPLEVRPAPQRIWVPLAAALGRQCLLWPRSHMAGPSPRQWHPVRGRHAEKPPPFIASNSSSVPRSID